MKPFGKFPIWLLSFYRRDKMKMKIRAKDGFKITNLNRRKAVRERCLNCTGWHPAEVKDCVHEDCQLYLFRSGAGKQNAQERSKAIREYCFWCSADQPVEVRKCPAFTCPLWIFRKSAVDRSREIKNLPEKPHIDPVFEGISMRDIQRDGIEPRIPISGDI